MPETPIANLPRWLVRHICRPENHKLIGKMPKRWLDTFSSGYGHGRTFATLPMLPRHTHGFPHHHAVVGEDRRLPAHYSVTDPAPQPQRMLTDLIAHLDNNDYRLWAEVRQQDPKSGTRLIMARCRWCHARFNLKHFEGSARKNHKHTCDYTHNLRAIYDLLLERGQCVQCNRHTREEAWGLPMCSEACRIEWKFSDSTSTTLAVGMVKTRNAGRLKLVKLSDEESDATLQLSAV